MRRPNELHWPHCLTKLSEQFAFVASVDVRLVHLGHVDLIRERIDGRIGQ